jgi:hypothetical protein
LRTVPQGSGTIVENGVYQGPSVNAFWDSIGCSGPVPIDQSHWAENCLNLEVLSPYFKLGDPWFLSGMTMGALEDLGYTVNRAFQDDFGLEQLGSNCGTFCPEKGSTRRLGQSQSSLSGNAHAKILQTAHEHFATDGSHRQSVSVLYQEGDHVVARIVHRADVD